MADADLTFAYEALGPNGGKVRGRVTAPSELMAFERLRRDGLAPLRLRQATRAEPSSGHAGRIPLSDRKAAELFLSLGTLLEAGADIRSALSMLLARSTSKASGQLCRVLLDEVSGGAPIQAVLANRLPARQGFVAALIAAAEASGALASGFERAAEVLSARCKFRDQLVSTLSYPAFVLVSTVAAVLLILLFVVPTLAPLVEEAGGHPPAALQVLLWMSGALSSHGVSLVSALGFAVVALGIMQRLGLLAEPVDRLLLDGPARQVRARLVYGAFAIVLGNMLGAGAPLGDALRLAIRTAPSALARRRMEAAAAKVRQGELLSGALDEVQAFPAAISRMCAVGERSGKLGGMLARAGKLEEEAAFRSIESFGRFLGPTLIVLLGGLVGILMATLLSGVNQIGQGVSQ